MSTKKTEILLVDDSTTNIALLSGILEEEGFLIETAFDGKEALKIVMRSTPDLILLDLMMPKMDGYEFLQAIKAIEGKKDIPIIVVSARTKPKEINRALELGAMEFLPKPLDIQLFIDKIRAMFG